ncbi:hypothetical protein EVAR_32714_1 [Eumeta japonica]|uniref:Uncharacterized protein n=1 Tax=Eumeta variegata TaxID=151549 RepID=A0A4C1ZDZ5_EUMVA|nr:hypothetical protein EVAR_32714_1 [Eumeta japonica]
MSPRVREGIVGRGEAAPTTAAADYLCQPYDLIRLGRGISRRNPKAYCHWVCDAQAVGPRSAPSVSALVAVTGILTFCVVDVVTGLEKRSNNRKTQYNRQRRLPLRVYPRSDCLLAHLFTFTYICNSALLANLRFSCGPHHGPPPLHRTTLALVSSLRDWLTFVPEQ